MNELKVHISELLKSRDAETFGIDNSAPRAALDKLQDLIYYVLQPTREHFGQPLNVTSGYRSKKLNDLLKKLGYHPSETSQHCTGEAADFVVRNISLQEIVKFIAKNLQFDQLILEYDKKTSWVHVSYRHGKNRKEVLKYENNVYSKYNVDS